MKLKTRLLMPLLALLMLGTATSAFADLTCAVTAIVAATPGPVPQAVNNGHWENPADLQFACTPVGTPAPAAATTDTSITVYFAGLTITNTTAIPAGHVISVANTAGALGAILDTTRADTGTPAVNNGGSLVAILLPAQAAPAAGTFVLQNVLLSLNGGTTIGGNVAANLNFVSPTGNTVLTGAPVIVINSVQTALNSTTAPPALIAPIVGQAAAPAQFTAAGTTAQPTPSCPALSACANAKSAFAVTVTEDHNNAWRAPATYYQNGIGVAGNGTAVLFTFAGMLPGAIISNCVLTPSNATQTWTLTGSGIAGSNGQTTISAEPVVTPLASIQSSLDTLTLACGTSVANPGYLVGGSAGQTATTPITVDMRPYPTGVALPGMGGAPATTGGTPRYNATGGVVGPVTVVQFGASAVGSTTMLLPYALANVGSYDTGIAIANTSKDTPFGTDAQGFAAPDTSGSIVFNFFPGDGSAPYTITPTTGFNLVSGQVAAGNSFIGTLSSILKSDSRTAAFQGYIIVQANFTHAHGTAYVYGGSSADRLTSATDVLVIANPLGLSRNPVNFPVAPSGVVGVEPTSK